jgi:hypothetical protein
MKLYIKNMVCERCKRIVQDELEKIGIDYVDVEIGEVTLMGKISSSQYQKLYHGLQQSGFELLDSRNNNIIEKLKKTIIDLAHSSDENLNTNYTDCISMSIRDSFISLSTLFSEIEGLTIEKYIIEYKIELIKELLAYDDLNLSEIAVKMHYSSTAQLSRQFKNVTGLMPLHFRQLQQTLRVNIKRN